MIKKYFLPLLVLLVIISGCAVNKKNYKPNKQFSGEQLRQDYTLLRNILEKKHPALYWYTPKDSMDYYFDSLYNNIADSMTEVQFGWSVLAPLTQKIRCGHTSFGMSKQWNKYIKDKQIPSFPLHLKLCADTMVVSFNLNKKDSILKRGTIITSINSVSSATLIHEMFKYLPADGYADNVNYVRLSSNFPYYHRSIYGIYKNYRVGYIDSTGREKKLLLPMFVATVDTTKKKTAVTPVVKKNKKKERIETIEGYRSLKIDTATNTALFTLNTFSNGDGKHLRRFIKKTFKKIDRSKIDNLILDLRGNGGGDVGLYVLLNKYLRKMPFRVADTTYAVTKSLRPYTKYIRRGFYNNIALIFFSKKKKDGNYHYGFWERHFYKPKKQHHYNGKLYVLTNGPTFSAATLLCNSIKGQSNVLLVGEETGGGRHGNNGILIPDITLPNTKLRVRLPLFKMVQFNHVPKTGSGIAPDVYIPQTVEGVKKGLDRKMDYVKDLIKKDAAAIR